MAVISTLKIIVEGEEYTVTGGTFSEMLSQVKAIEGRRWGGDQNKVWILPITFQQAREVLGDYKILCDEDEVIDAEIAEIKQLQEWILEDEEEVLAEAQRLDLKVKSYSFRSRSSVKAAIATNAACLHHAIHSAKLPIEKLAEIQIRGMKSACQLMGWL